MKIASVDRAAALPGCIFAAQKLFVDFFFSFFRVRYSILMAHTYAIIISNNTKKKISTPQ